MTKEEKLDDFIRYVSMTDEERAAVIDTGLCAAGQRCNSAACNGSGNRADAFAFHGRSDGKTGFHDIYAELFQLPGHLDLFRKIHAASRRLLTIPQSSVKDLNPSHAVILHAPKLPRCHTTQKGRKSPAAPQIT